MQAGEEETAAEKIEAMTCSGGAAQQAEDIEREREREHEPAAGNVEMRSKNV